MKKIIFALAAILLLAPGTQAAPPKWEQSLINVQATRKTYNPSRPWSRSSSTTVKTAMVIGKNQFLTTAEGLQDLSMLRVQKDGRGTWWDGKLKWVDYHANIAVVSAAEEEFSEGLVPVKMGNVDTSKKDWQILRWKSGNVEKRAAEFNQFLVQEGRLTFIQHLQLEASSEIDAVGWGEPLVSGGKVVAIATGQADNNIRFIPVKFFRKVLAARQAGKNRGLGYFPFVWSPVANPETYKFLKLDGEPRGAMVLEVPVIPRVKGRLKPKDIILEVDGFPIDNEGYYRDPDLGLIIMENLSTRGKLAGDVVKMKIWRDGKAINVNYPLPPIRYTDKLLPERTFDQEPEYLIVGGLMFQPLNVPLLRAFGGNWRTRAPFRLSKLASELPTKERKAMVALTVVIPDPYNLGYQNARWLPLDTINDQRISTIADIRAALKKPINGFHEVRFMKGSSTERMVLDADRERETTQRILRHYRIPAPSFFGTN
ncbi:MAG: hypothetical protein CMO80_12030 [Verrucomicrobiales bacterium]|nr:hypothetical protein [Verrucomicrobiales bacterium]